MKTLIRMVTASGEEHGLINTLPNSVPFDDFKSMAPENKEKCRKELANRKKLVKGKYINYQNSNERLEKTYCAGSGEPLQQYRLIPDYVYDLPLGFIEEVNASFIPQRSDLVSVDGNPMNKDHSPTTKEKNIRVHEIVPVSF